MVEALEMSYLSVRVNMEEHKKEQKESELKDLAWYDIYFVYKKSALN